MSAAIRKPFQEATVDHVVCSLRASGASRRFLVADEVGLGKTLVAQGVIQDLIKRARRRGRAPCVLYVCSNLTIAKQNHEALVDFLKPGERNDHQGDRLALLPRDDLEASELLRLYSLTPYTSTGSGGGRAEERALLANALEQLRLRSHIDGRYSRHIIERLSLTVDPDRFEKLRKHEKNEVQNNRVLQSFRTHLCKLLERSEHAHTSTIFDCLKSRFDEHATSGVEVLRRAMALAVLDVLSPDLVILDEFQRFSEMLPDPVDDRDEDDASDGDAREVNAVMRAILRADVPRRERPYVLMLSATPYRLFTRASEGHQHHEGFFTLMRFLLDDKDKMAGLKEGFDAYRDRLATTTPGDKELLALRDRLEASLLVAMCRTERPNAADAPTRIPVVPNLSLTADDVKVFRQLAEAATDTPFCAEPYWSSIPYPLQAMDAQYVLRRRVDDNGTGSNKAEAPQLSFESVRAYRPITHAHPRLRGLLDVMPASLRPLPWLPPTLPWWDLALPFSPAKDASKALVFSHFRATPRILAAIVSYEAERDAYANSKVRYDYRLRTRSAVRGAARVEEPGEGAGNGLHHQPRSAFSMVRGKGRIAPNLRTLLHFAPVLASMVDPLEMASEARRRGESLTFENARRIAGERLLDVLGGSSQPKRGRALDWERIARWVVTLESRQDEKHLRRLRGALDAWATENGERPGAAEACRHLANQELAPFATSVIPTTNEIEVLAELALASPGAALFRAWERIFGRARGAHLERRMTKLVAIGLADLATYLDTPEWHVSLRPPDFGAHPGRRSFADVVRSAVWGGNLESVLDELLATFVRYARPSRAQEDVAVERIGRALTLRDASVAIRRTAKSGPGKAVRMRCHAGAPLGLSSREVMDDNDALRTDNLRVAFNSPFRPMMLVTTSIGQEGLDFHQYARRVVHWDLPSDPVELEQRDGRLMRFGSLAVRQALAGPMVRGDTPVPQRGSPWLTIGAWAREHESADGMSPWWVADGAAIERVLLVPPFSRQRADFDELEDLVALYRVALGQPDQEHLIRAVRTRIDNASESDRGPLREWYRDVSLRLSPWHRRHPSSPRTEG